MIHRDVDIIDLDPQTWRHLGAIFPVAEWGEQRRKVPGVLTVMHDEGTVIQIDIPAEFSAKDSAIIPTYIEDPVATARAIYEAYPDLTRIQIFEKSSVQAFSSAVQRLDWTQLSSGDFYLRAAELAATDPRGLCYYPAGLPRVNVLKAARDLIQNTPDGHHLVLGVYDENRPYFSLIIRVDSGQIRMVTTFDALVKYGIDTTQIPSSDSDRDVIIPLVEHHFGPVARVLFCNRSTLLALVNRYSEVES